MRQVPRPVVTVNWSRRLGMDPPSGRRTRTPRCCGPRTAVFTACCRSFNGL